MPAWIEKAFPMKKSHVVADPLAELARDFEMLGRRYSLEQVFSDWVFMAATSISNRVDLRKYDEREAEYMRIIRGYTKDEANTFGRMLALFTLELEKKQEDVMGRLMLKLEVGRNKWLGQFFSPWSISYMMAKMALGTKDECEAMIAEKGYLACLEPACGAGVMVLAVARAMEELGINFQRHLHVTAIDIDRRCVHMTYLQTSLMGIPAHVILGDSLRDTFRDDWFTPFHIMDGWTQRLKGQSAIRATPFLHMAPKTMTPAEKAALELIAADALPDVHDIVGTAPADKFTQATVSEATVPLPPHVAALATPGHWSIVLPPRGSTPPFQGAARAEGKVDPGRD